MRSQLIVLAAISLAVSGCGKSVERTGNAAVLGQQNGAPAAVLGGICEDPIRTPYKEVARFSDIAMAIGSYDLVSFEAVGTAGMGTSAPSGISVVSGSVGADGALAYNEICHDLSAMPQSHFRWTTVAPDAFDARNGSTRARIELAQTVYGPAIVDGNEARAPRTTLGSGRSEGRLNDARYFQIDATTIGVLRSTTSSRDGVTVESKIFARYAFNAGAAPMTHPPKRSDQGRHRKSTEQGKSANQGKPTEQGKSVNQGKPTEQGKSANQGKPTEQGKSANQGKPTHRRSERCDCVVPPTSPSVTTTPPTQTGAVKVKIRLIESTTTPNLSSNLKFKLKGKIKNKSRDLTDGE